MFKCLYINLTTFDGCCITALYSCGMCHTTTGLNKLNFSNCVTDTRVQIGMKSLLRRSMSLAEGGE